MTPYEAVLYRKSIRNINSDPLAPGILERIRSFAGRVSRIDPAIPVQVDILDLSRNKVTFIGPFRVKAPYYLMISADRSVPGSMLEAGYISQQMVLYLTERGIATCYQGGIKCVNIRPAKGMSQIMIIAFGSIRGRIYRSPEQAKRLPLNRICTFREQVEDDMRTIVEAARMAPSSMNSQPCRYAVYANRIHVLVKDGPARTGGNSADFAAGIALYNMEVAAQEEWMELTYEQLEVPAECKLKKCRYVITVRKCQETFEED